MKETAIHILLAALLLAASGRVSGQDLPGQTMADLHDNTAVRDGIVGPPATSPVARQTVPIDGGEYMPLYRTPYDAGAVQVAPFEMDVYPVTNLDFLAFVRANHEWRRSVVSRLFADANYLRHWESDSTLGSHALPKGPIVNVSWFAAMAYTDWTGARLPTEAEWEFAAAAGARHPDGRIDPDHYQRIVDWYGRPTPVRTEPVGSTTRNYWGVHDLHGLVWEWVFDFNSSTVTGESRNNADLDRKLFCGSGSIGASDFRDYPAFMRFAFRSSLEGAYTTPNLGFRTIRDLARPLSHELQ